MNVPKLRFKGFKGEWKKKKLREVADIIGGGTPKTTVPEYWDGEIDWYSPSEIGNQIYLNHSKRKITKLGLQKSSARMLPVGTILFTSRAGIGNTAILAKEATTNQGFQSIVPNKNKLDTYFIYSRSHELKRYGEINGAGSTFIEVSGKQMEQMLISLPEIKEQQKIGLFFEKLDQKIQLQQEKIDLLQKQKKGFLQKMFPKAGETQPELRFRGINESWKNVSLNHLVERVTRKNRNLESNFPLTISAERGLVDQVTYFNKSVSSKDLTGYYLLKRGEFAYNRSYSNGYPWGAIKRLEKYEKGVLSTLYICFKVIHADSEFIKYYFETAYWHKEVYRIAAEGARNHGLLNISINDFFKIKINIPSEIEQERIVMFFNEIDRKIDFEKNKFINLEEQKKGFLQQMFV